jgi:hypothetical protein
MTKAVYLGFKNMFLTNTYINIVKKSVIVVYLFIDSSFNVMKPQGTTKFQ